MLTNNAGKRWLAVLLIVAGFAATLWAGTADSYRNNTPDDLIKNMPSSIKNLRSKGAEAYLEKVAEFIANQPVHNLRNRSMVIFTASQEDEYAREAAFSPQG